jgi:hypothetical protein
MRLLPIPGHLPGRRALNETVVSRGNRIAALALIVGSAVCVALLVVAAANLCPTELPGQPCAEAGRNRAVIIGLASLAAGLLVAPLVFLAEVARRRGVVYRGAWLRASRRGLLASATIGALGGLRMAGALSVPGAIFIVLLAAVLEWFARRMLDRP